MQEFEKVKKSLTNEIKKLEKIKLDLSDAEVRGDPYAQVQLMKQYLDLQRNLKGLEKEGNEHV